MQELCSKITEKSLDYISGIQVKLRFPDQDALNVAAHQRWFGLDDKWNYLTRLNRDCKPAREHAGILHFAGPRKPWNENFPNAELRAQYVSLMESVASLALPRS